MNLFLISLLLMPLMACASVPQLDPQEVRPWSDNIGEEYPQNKPVIAHYKKNNYELFYLAAKHSTRLGDETMNLVERLFKDHQFKVLLIEPLPYSVGESPAWFVEEVKKGKTDKLIPDSEGGYAALLANEKKIPFFSGEPDMQDIYQGLKNRKYTDEDIVGFFTVRQIPQWVRQGEKKSDLLKRKMPGFATNTCKQLSISKCPTYEEILKWYRSMSGHPLSADVLNNEFAPLSEGPLLSQKISFEIGLIRDPFTLNIIQGLLQKYQKVAVIYGAGHFFTLRKSFDKALGMPQFIEDKR